MLRGVFGNFHKGWSIPDEVLQRIFELGFHLWLKRPWEIQIEFGVPRDLGTRDELYLGITYRHLVVGDQLSQSARRVLTNEYLKQALGEHVAARNPTYRPARPLVLDQRPFEFYADCADHNEHTDAGQYFARSGRDFWTGQRYRDLAWVQPRLCHDGLSDRASEYWWEVELRGER
jgi:hypothetical protein